MMVGAKTIETRSWATKHLGPLVICAATGGLRHDDLWRLLQDPNFQRGLAPLCPGRTIRISHLNFGKALCVVNLDSCISTDQVHQNDHYSNEIPFGNYAPGRIAWRTNILRRIEPFPVKGKQRFFEVPDELIRYKVQP